VSFFNISTFLNREIREGARMDNLCSRASRGGITGIGAFLKGLKDFFAFRCLFPFFELKQPVLQAFSNFSKTPMMYFACFRGYGQLCKFGVAFFSGKPWFFWGTFSRRIFGGLGIREMKWRSSNGERRSKFEITFRSPFAMHLEEH
jgi:hypothetical protein